MTKLGEFSLQFNAAVDQQTTLEILFCFEDREPPREHLISGFPRIINDDKTSGKALIPKSVTGMLI
jgi:hypothetical protein